MISFLFNFLFFSRLTAQFFNNFPIKFSFHEKLKSSLKQHVDLRYKIISPVFCWWDFFCDLFSLPTRTKKPTNYARIKIQGLEIYFFDNIKSRIIKALDILKTQVIKPWKLTLMKIPRILIIVWNDFSLFNNQRFPRKRCPWYQFQINNKKPLISSQRPSCFVNWIQFLWFADERRFGFVLCAIDM